MEKIDFGFKGLNSDNKISRDSTSFQAKSLQNFFGQKSFETSWQFIETLA